MTTYLQWERLNAVKEICGRCPLAVSDDLLQDLTQYKTHRDRSVMMAARSLIQLYRKVNPELLLKKDKGKPTEAGKDLKVLQYAEKDTRAYLPGTEALAENDEANDEKKSGEDWESCSEDDDNDDDDDEWVNVNHSSDEEADMSQVPETKEEQEQKAMTISTSRILTQEEFKQLQQLQAARETEGMKTSAGSDKKRKRQAEDEEEDRGELLKLSMIENVHKKRAHDKDSRLATVMAGREDRPKYTHGPRKMNPHASTTNKDKERGKNYTMIKHKVMNRKKKRSFRDKQIALRNSLLKKQKSKR